MTRHFVGDPHLYHDRVALIRGYANGEAMAEAFAHLVTRTVSIHDTLYILGDCSSGREEDEYRALQLLKTLPGIKILIVGNHDSVSGIHRKYACHTEMFRDVFTEIHEYTRIRMENRMVILSHYPYLSSGDGPGRGPARYEWARMADTGELLIHAHTHHTDPFDGSSTGREMCVSWDAWRKRFATDADISKWVQSRIEHENAVIKGFGGNLVPKEYR